MITRFRWASLQLQSLCSARTDEAIRERLGQLPPNLEDLYLELYEKLTKTSANADREVTINAFSWLLCAQRKLTSREFLAAMSTTPRRQFHQLTKKHILEMCSNMVVFDSTLDTFRFAHLSVREFLEKRPEYTREATNALAAETCLLDVLSAADNPTTKRLLSKYGQDSLNSTLSHDLRHYSNVYWAPHCQLAAKQRTADVLNDLLCHFLSNESDSGSAIAVWASLIKERLYDYSIEMELRDKFKDTSAKEGRALFVASCFDFQEIARIRANFGDNIVNTQSRTSLEIAVKYGSCDVVSILLKNKLTIISEEVVKAAAGNSRNGKEVMTLLLEQRGADMMITEEVVKAAVTCGQDRVLKTIEEKFKISPSKEEWSIAQFYNAAKFGKADTIQKILAEGVKPDLKNSRHVSPLWISAANGHLRVVQLLLRSKIVDINTKSIYGQPPIFWAAAEGNENIVRLLLTAGADRTLEDIDGKTPLSVAKKNGHDKIAKMLSGG